MAQAFGKAVIIGLGGTGQKALIRIKKMFLDQCGGGLPPCIKLLAFDTSSNQEKVNNTQGKEICFDQDEFLHLRVGSVRTAIESDYVKKWWIPYPTLDALTISEGSGGIRQVGRLAVFVNIDRVQQALRGAFDAIDQFGVHEAMRERDMELLNITPQVYVIGSFAGGTGSGSFFDFSILCRALGGSGMFYSAFFVLPWIYRNQAKTANENSYGALLELEKLNGCTPANAYSTQYGSDASQEFRLEERPYHIVNLVDGKCRNGYKIQSSAELCQFIGECVFNSVGAIGEQAHDVVNNIMTMINLAQPADWEQCQAMYSTFGVSSIVYPGDAILERMSIDYALGLIASARKFIAAPPSLPLKGMDERYLQPFVAETGLEPTDNGLLAKLLPDGTFMPYREDEDLDLRSTTLQADVAGDLDRWEKRANEECTAKLNEHTPDLKAQINDKITELLERVKNAEKTDPTNHPKGSYEAANRQVLQFCMDARDGLSETKKQEARNRENLELDLQRYDEALAQRRAWRPFSTNPARIAYRSYYETRVKLLESKLRLAKIEKGLELYGSWVKEAEDRNTAIVGDSEALKASDEKLKSLESALTRRQHELTSERLLRQKSPFEIFVGLRSDGGRDIADVSEGTELPSATDFDAFRREVNMVDQDYFTKAKEEELEDAFMAFARRKLAPSVAISVTDVLDQMEDKETIIAQAVRNSTLLLPINDDLLSAKQKSIAEFTVIGGEQREKLKDSLSACLPHDDRVQNLWASTGDRYRITLCRHFAAIPLYVLKDIWDIRSEYLERLFPPAHTDRYLEFQFGDALPKNAREVRVLKLLSLSLLDPPGLIRRVQQPNGSKFYRLDPSVLGNPEYVDDEDLQLPGKPGKFYSLYAELMKDGKLQDRLETALLEAAKTPDFQKNLMAVMRERLELFQAILANKYKEKADQDSELTFTKMMTGNLYRQEAAFYKDMLQHQLTVSDVLKR